jgi:hypothetical protein
MFQIVGAAPISPTRNARLNPARQLLTVRTAHRRASRRRPRNIGWVSSKVRPCVAYVLRWLRHFAASAADVSQGPKSSA